MTQNMPPSHTTQDDPSLLLKGVGCYQRGEFQEASGYFHQFLTHHPTHGDALNLLALSYQGEKAFSKALDTIHQAIQSACNLPTQQASPEGLPDWYNTQSTIYYDLEKWELAREAADSGLRLNPHHPDLLQNRGLACLSLGKLEGKSDQKDKLLHQALSDFHQALQLDPGFLEAALNLLNTHTHLKNEENATHLIEQLKAVIHPEHPLWSEFIQNRCHLLQLQKKYDEAVILLLDCLQKQPQQGIFYDLLGTMYTTLEKKDLALKAYREAVLLAPDNIRSQYNFATLLFDTKQYAHAEMAYQNALNINAHHVKSLLGLADLYQKQNRSSEAVALLEKVTQLDPDAAYPILHAIQLPVVYQNQEEIEIWRARYTTEITMLLERAKTHGLALKNPVFDVSQLYFFLAYQGKNDKPLQEIMAQLFYHAPVYRAPDMKKTVPPFNQQKHPLRKLRIGFLSRFLRPSHTIGKLWGPLLMAMPSDRYDTFLLGIEDETLRHQHWFSTVPPSSHQTYVPLPLDDIQKACQQIQAQQLDLILFCDIGMEPTAYFIAFSRLAPVQCVTWGHPVTTGLPTMDYFLSSKHLEKTSVQKDADENNCYTETLVQFPHVNVYYQKPEIQTPKTRQELGLSEEKTLYVCAQSLYKFHPAFDEVLQGILNDDPNGEIVLINAEQTHVVSDLRKRWERTLGGLQQNIKIINSLKYDEYLNLMNLADITLDPFPFGGGNTQLESFAFGTPVITKPDDYLKGRITGALYHQMAEWEPEVLFCLAATSAEYVEKAVYLGKNPEFRHQLSQKILNTHPTIFETKAVIQEFDEFCQEAIFKAQSAGFYS
jgi:protein O-GlcNAc transferase